VRENAGGGVTPLEHWSVGLSFTFGVQEDLFFNIGQPVYITDDPMAEDEPLKILILVRCGALSRQRRGRKLPPNSFI